jgi:uncharacterized membrane protein
MAAQDAKATTIVYLLAIAFGLMVAVPALTFAKFLSGILNTHPHNWWFIFAPVMFLTYAGVGAFFGLSWPSKSWRWGVWASLLPFIWASFVDPAAVLLLAGIVVLPACAGALAASRYQLRRIAARHAALLNRAARNRRYLTYD